MARELHVAYGIPVCLVLLCIICLVGSASAQLAIFAAGVCVACVNWWACRTKHDPAEIGYSRKIRTRKQPTIVFGGDPTIGMPRLAVIQKIEESRYANYYKRHELFMNTILADYGMCIESCPPPRMTDTYILVPDKFEELVSGYLRIKHGGRDCITQVDVGGTITRLATRRSLVFVGNDNDEHITRRSAGAADDVTEADEAGARKYHAHYNLKCALTAETLHEQRACDYKYHWSACTCIGASNENSNHVHARLDNIKYESAAATHNLLADETARVVYPSIPDTVSYDEMMLSALCGMSAHTRFKNTGAIGNMGVRGSDIILPIRDHIISNTDGGDHIISKNDERTCRISENDGGDHIISNTAVAPIGISMYTSYEHDGILVGLVGEQFGVRGYLGWRTMLLGTNSVDDVGAVVGAYIDTIEFPYGLDCAELCQLFDCCTPVAATYTDTDTDINRVRANLPGQNVTAVFGETDTTAERGNIQPDPVAHTARDLREPFGKDKLNLLRLVRRLAIPARLLLDDAVRRKNQRQFVGREPYVVAGGLDSGLGNIAAEDTARRMVESMEVLNLYAWLSCMTEPAYSCIPIIEYR